jgi:hypothetical protein
LIELCKKYAEKYNLEEGKSLANKFGKIIAAEIIRNDHYTTTPQSVLSTLRGDKLKFKKKK